MTITGSIVPGFKSRVTVPLALNAFAPTVFLNLVDTSGGAQTLNEIVPPRAGAQVMVGISSASNGMTVNSNTGTNKIMLASGTALSFTSTTQFLWLETDGTTWTELGRFGFTSSFGGYGTRQAPTSGTLTGEYWHDGDWTTTGPVTFTRCRLHVRGALSLQHAWSVTTDLPGGLGSGSTSIAPSGQGGGIGGGANGIPASAAAVGGAGGGYGGAGGNGGYSVAGIDRGCRGGQAYDILQYLGGSGGSGGCSNSGSFNGGNGGAGGGGLYLEATGAIIINANGTLDGGNGQAAPGTGSGGGGAGSGGGLDARSASSLTVMSGITISAQGGTGGAGATSGCGGAGGGGGYIALHSPSTTTAGATLNVNGGAAGSGTSPTAPTAGATGVTLVESVAWGPRTN